MRIAAKSPQLKMKLQNMPTPMIAEKKDIDRLMKLLLETTFTGIWVRYLESDSSELSVRGSQFKYVLEGNIVCLTPNSSLTYSQKVKRCYLM